MSRSRAKCGCCLTTCLVNLVICFVLVLAAVWAYNSLKVGMIKKLGITEINSVIDDFGLENVLIKDVFGVVNSLKNTPNERDIVKNVVVEKDATDVQAKLENLGLKSDTNPNGFEIEDLFKSEILTPSEQILKFRDGEFAALLNMLISKGSKEFEGLSSLETEIRQVSIIVNGEGENKTFELVIVFKVKLPEELKSIGFIKLGDSLYLTAKSSLKVSNEGVLSASNKSIIVNALDGRMSDIIMNAIVASATAEGETKIDINKTIGDAFCKLINNLGRIGKGESKDDFVFGNVGIEKIENNTYLNIITRVNPN